MKKQIVLPKEMAQKENIVPGDIYVVEKEGQKMVLVLKEKNRGMKNLSRTSILISARKLKSQNIAFTKEDLKRMYKDVYSEGQVNRIWQQYIIEVKENIT